MIEYVTDTHPLIWFVTNNKSLSQKAKELFLDSNNHIHIPILVIIETNYLYHKGKISCSGNDLKSDIECLDHWHLQDFTIELFDYCLTELSIHDAMICAYAIQNNLSVITKDQEIVNHPKIQSAW